MNGMSRYYDNCALKKASTGASLDILLTVVNVKFSNGADTSIKATELLDCDPYL